MGRTFHGTAGVRREARRSRVPAGRIHSARGCQIKRGPHGTSFHGTAGVRRETRRSRVPAGRIHSARGCQIKRGPHGTSFHGDGADGGTRTRKDLHPTDFKSVVYTDSTTSAYPQAPAPECLRLPDYNNMFGKPRQGCGALFAGRLRDAAAFFSARQNVTWVSAFVSGMLPRSGQPPWSRP